MSTKDAYTKAGQALAKQADDSPKAQLANHKLFLQARAKQISTWVRQGVSAEALVRFTLMDMQTNAKLRECTQMSIYLGLLACAVSGLEPGALKGEAYLVPFRNKGIYEATFIPGWKGLVKQARRSREVVGIVANVVMEHDTFDLDEGTANTVVHKPLLRGERGPVIGAYAIARMATGHNEIEWIDRADLDKIAAIGISKGSPAWKEWGDQMARKSALRRLAKRLPLGADYYVSLALEQASDDGRSQAEVLDIETDGAASSAGASADMAPAAPEPETEEEEILRREREEAARG